jgi:hypothetical protein
VGLGLAAEQCLDVSIRVSVDFDRSLLSLCRALLERIPERCLKRTRFPLSSRQSYTELLVLMFHKRIWPSRLPHAKLACQALHTPSLSLSTSLSRSHHMHKHKPAGERVKLSIPPLCPSLPLSHKHKPAGEEGRRRHTQLACQALHVIYIAIRRQFEEGLNVPLMRLPQTQTQRQT